MSVNSANGIAFPLSTNAIINGAFDIWQRGTSFTQVGTSDIYSADRWQLDVGGDAAGRLTCSRETFTPAELNVVGFGEAQFYARLTQNVVGSSTRFNIKQKIEDVRTLAGQTITLSFWAKANNAFTLLSSFDQDFGSGGSALVSTTGPSFSVTTSWQRFSGTISLPSISGKTVGTSSFLQLYFNFPPDTASDTFDIWGVQLEAGLVATPFRRSSSTIQGELAACQRYFWKFSSANSSGGYMPFAMAHAIDSGSCRGLIRYPVTMRRIPTLSFSAASTFLKSFGNAMTSVVAAELGVDSASIQWGRSSEFSANQGILITANNTKGAYINFESEI